MQWGLVVFELVEGMENQQLSLTVPFREKDGKQQRRMLIIYRGFRQTLNEVIDFLLEVIELV